MNNLAIVMSSCDIYEDLWEPFFECLDVFGGEGIEQNHISVYLNTEHKEFVPKKKLKFTVKTITQKGDKILPWSKRFIDVLHHISEDYIFLVLDDFFVCDYIQWDYFGRILKRMNEDSSIASFQMCGTRTRNSNPDTYKITEEFELDIMGKEGWKTHFVPTIWRKSVLLKWLRSWESIWAFEECGSKRARRWNYPEKVYVVSAPLIYDYLWIKDCSAVINGKWLAEKELLEFFERYKINVDWTKRGKMTWEEYQAITMKDVLKKYTVKQIIIKSFNRVRSFF